MKDEGSSILEVIIAVMILALAGAVLVGGLYMSRVVTERTTQKREVLSQLAEAANVLNSEPYIPCSDTSDLVYPTPPTSLSNKLGEVSFKVEVLGTDNAWGSCTQVTNAPQKGVQKITLWNTVHGETVSSVIVKVRG